MKAFISLLTVLVVATFGYFVLVTAQVPIPQVCGDGIVQAPNEDIPIRWERCDDGTGDGNSPVQVESATCTADCQAKILGWAWSSNIGWISLSDESCNPDYLPDELEGICPYDDPDDPDDPPLPNYNIIVGTNANGPVSGYAWSDNVGWICFGSDCSSTAPDSGSADITLDFSGDTLNPPLEGWANIVNLGTDGWISLNCAETGICGTSGFNVTYSQASFEGINAKTLSGFGWNGNSDGTGIGWIQFSPPIGTILPWLQTKYGDIYSSGDITGNAPPSTAYNATYRILSGGGVTQFSSRSEGFGGNIFVSPNFGPIDFPTPDTRYSNVLGSLDVEALIAKADVFGTPLNDSAISSFLGGKIYHSLGDLEINDGDGGISQFENGAGFGDGSGTIIVEGDLTIKTDLTYATGGATDRFRNLASVAWIVLGDLHIDGDVQNLAGNFIVLGNGSSCDPVVAGCGQVLSCSPPGNCGNQLTVAGLIMAPLFVFDRTFTNLQGTVEFQGSEIIIYDGRLLANTPPGLGDFAKALPIWRAGTFER